MKRSRWIRMTIFGCKTGAVLLAWAFGSGLLAGSLVSGGAQAVFTDERLVLAQSAGVSAFVPAVLPLLISGFAVYAGWPLLLIPAAFWKAFSFSYVALGVIRAWGSAGWMVGGLAMFAGFSAAMFFLFRSFTVESYYCAVIGLMNPRVHKKEN